MSAQRGLRFAKLAHALAREVLPRYAPKFSPRRFTLPQRAACVLLKDYRQRDGRGLQALLELSPELRAARGLRQVPDSSTLWRFAQRWLKAGTPGCWLAALARRLGSIRGEVAVDSTGLDSGRTRSYFMARPQARRRRKRHVQLRLRVGVGPWLRSGQAQRQLNEALLKAVAYSIHR